MRRNVLRVGVALTLLAAGAWGVVTLADLERRAAVADTIGSRLDRLHTTVAKLGASQTSHVLSTDDPERPLESVPRLLSDAAAAIADIGAQLRSPEGTRALQAFVDAASKLAQSDGRVRDSLLVGDTLTAAQIVTGDAREARADMQEALVTLRAAETAVREQDRADALSHARLVLAVVALVWVLGLLVLTPAPRLVSTSTRRTESAAESPATIVAPEPIDLDEIAGLCMEIARVETSAGIDALLGRAVQVLDAARVVLWVVAGDELIPVMVHGGAGEGNRPAPVRRDADRDAARVWRRAALQTTPSDAGAPGEILAPMIGSAGCSGVLAVQLGDGREAHPLARAAIVMIAAQLSTVVTGIPQGAATR